MNRPTKWTHLTFSSLLMGIFLNVSIASDASPSRQYHCEENLQAETGTFANGVSLFFVDVKLAADTTESPYECRYGKTGSNWGGGGQSISVPCTVHVSGSTVLVKDTGGAIRMAIDESAFIWRGFPKLGSDRRLPKDENLPFASFATVRQEHSGTTSNSGSGFRLDCRAI